MAVNLSVYGNMTDVKLKEKEALLISIENMRFAIK